MYPRKYADDTSFYFGKISAAEMWTFLTRTIPMSTRGSRRDEWTTSFNINDAHFVNYFYTDISVTYNFQISATVTKGDSAYTENLPVTSGKPRFLSGDLPILNNADLVSVRWRNRKCY